MVDRIRDLRGFLRWTVPLRRVVEPGSVAPVTPVDPAARLQAGPESEPVAYDQAERRHGERRRRKVPVLLDTRTGDRRLHAASAPEARPGGEHHLIDEEA